MPTDPPRPSRPSGARGAARPLALALALAGAAARCAEPARPPSRPAPTGHDARAQRVETGAQFAARLAALGGAAREAAILAAVCGGEAPAAALRPVWPVAVTAGAHRGVFYVARDYVGVGVESDWLRVPMLPATAQRIADRFGALLPTRRMVDAVYAAAAVRIPFVPLRPHGSVGRGSTELYVVHNAAIERLRAGRTGLAAGHKKDVVVGALAQRHPGRVLIYGAWYDDGSRVQPLTAVHDDGYVDYSHGVRLVAPVMVVDGRQRRVAEVLADPELCALLSDEGPVPVARY